MFIIIYLDMNFKCCICKSDFKTSIFAGWFMT